MDDRFYPTRVGKKQEAERNTVIHCGFSPPVPDPVVITIAYYSFGEFLGYIPSYPIPSLWATKNLVDG
jgi:hypothetical protein